MLTLAVPCLAAVAGLRLFARRSSADRLWTFLGSFTLTLSVLTFVEYVVFPDMLLFYKRWAYDGDFTLVFVNRNTAATFLGVALVVHAERLARHMRKVEPARLWHHLLRFDFRWSGKYGQAIIKGGACLLLAASLFSTHSRAGIASSLIGLFCFAIMVRRRTAPLKRAFGKAWLVEGAVVLAVVAVSTLLLGGEVLGRLQEQGLDDESRLCTYASALNVIRDHWVAGTGFGTFVDIFPSYRSAECGIAGVWDRAHNSYLEFLMGVGVFGIWVLFRVFSLVIGALLSGVVRSQDPNHIPAAALASLVIVACHAALDFSLQIPGVAVLVVGVLVAGVSASLAPPSEPSSQDSRRFLRPQSAPPSDSGAPLGGPVDGRLSSYDQ
jgi:O-antigen ligase